MGTGNQPIRAGRPAGTEFRRARAPPAGLRLTYVAPAGHDHLAGHEAVKRIAGSGDQGPARQGRAGPRQAASRALMARSEYMTGAPGSRRVRARREELKVT